MTIYKFETEFTIHYHYDDGADFNPSNDDPNIYLFDSYPSWELARSGTGALQTITSWTPHSGHGGAKDITISPISDPEPTGGITERVYYLAINYTTEVGGTEITDIKEIIVSRPIGYIVLAEKSVDADEVKKFFPEIVSYASDDQLNDFIIIARSQVSADLRKKGYEINQIRNQEDFYLPLAYKIIALVSHAEFNEAGDRHYTRFEDFNKMYQEYMRGLKIHVDLDANGSVDLHPQPFMPFLTNIK